MHAQTPLNLDFERGMAGGIPDGWVRPTAVMYAVRVDTTIAHGGRKSVLIEGSIAPQGFGNVLQEISALPYRGKRVRFTGWVRLANVGALTRAALWLRVDRVNGGPGFFDNMSERPVRTPGAWQQYEIVGDVAADAETITFGMMLEGSGLAWLDDVALDVLGPTPAASLESARALTPRGRDNLIALARLIGYVRYFHPSDGAVSTDWDAFTIAAVRLVERAPDARALRNVLDSLFAPIAPTISIAPAGAPPAPLPATLDADRVLQWQHHGVGAQGYGIYRSVRASHARNGLSDTIPDPRRPLLRDLGSGIALALPLTVFADSLGTLPRSAPWRAAAAALPAPTRGVHSGDDRATRLAGVILAWNVFQHFYPYFDVVEADWPAELTRALNAAATDRDAAAFQATLRTLVAALHDGHGSVVHRETARQNGYLPAFRWDWIEDRLVVTEVGSVATQLRHGDVVVRIDGRPTGEVLAREAALTSGATPQWTRTVAVRQLLAGPRTRPLALTVLRAGRDTVRVEVARDATSLTPETLPAPIEEVSPGIMYVDLDRVTTAAFRAARERLAAARGLIFDLRGYPRQVNAAEVLSHLIQEPATSAQWHIPYVTTPDRERLAFNQSPGWNIQPAAVYFPAPRVFLTGGGAISYAESVMGIVAHYRLADIVGETTAGTNGNVNLFILPGGYQIGWTGMKVLKHDGSRHHGVGIAPTLSVKRTIAGVTRGEDEVLNAAIQLLRSR